MERIYHLACLLLLPARNINSNEISLHPRAQFEGMEEQANNTSTDDDGSEEEKSRKMFHRIHYQVWMVQTLRRAALSALGGFVESRSAFVFVYI